MTYIGLLPSELSDYIYNIRDTDAITKIQKMWHKFQAPKIVAQKLCENLSTEPEGLSVMNPETATILEYTARILSGKENHNIWVDFLETVNSELYIDQYTGGPGAKYYNRCDKAYKTLYEKFGLNH